MKGGDSPQQPCYVNSEGWRSRNYSLARPAAAGSAPRCSATTRTRPLDAGWPWPTAPGPPGASLPGPRPYLSPGTAGRDRGQRRRPPPATPAGRSEGPGGDPQHRAAPAAGPIHPPPDPTAAPATARLTSALCIAQRLPPRPPPAAPLRPGPPAAATTFRPSCGRVGRKTPTSNPNGWGTPLGLTDPGLSGGER